MSDFFYDIKEKFLSDRINILYIVFSIFFCVLFGRLFLLQIVRGKSYLANYNLLVEKKESIDATRGNIYDRNGNLLAYNEMAYSVTIEDTYSGMKKAEKNKALNDEIYNVVKNIDRLGDSVNNDFNIRYNSDGSYEFTVSGTSLQRFRADIFGKTKMTDLGYDKDLDMNLANVSAKDIVNYLYSDKKFDVSKEYEEKYRFEIAAIRYAISLNSYRKYISTPIATGVSASTVAYIKENSNDLPGVNIEEKSIRKYTDSKYFAHILGYTGKISTEEYDELKKTDSSVSTSDIIGKTGIEKEMNSYLTGKKGSNTLYVDNIGNIIKETNHKDAVPGNDVYLSIDKDLQEKTYNLLEAKVAGILASNIVNIKTFKNTPEQDSIVPVYDAYINLVQNQVIDTTHFDESDATELEKTVKSEFEGSLSSVTDILKNKLGGQDIVSFGDETDEYVEYESYIINMLKDKKILDSSKIDTSDSKYKSWADGKLSINEYLEYCIEKDWVDVASISDNIQYADTSELYKNLCDKIIDLVTGDRNFGKIVYKYAIINENISSGQILALLYDQGVLAQDDETRDSLLNGNDTVSYNFMISKINSLEITPGQLGLTPCSASCVIINPQNGELLACVSYPGYDNNRLANSVDSKYYSYLNACKSSPMYDHATQQMTAPGSTFKMVTSTAGLTEGVIDLSTTFECTGEFDIVSNKPKCWIYPGRHGEENVVSALKDSCNVYFYNVGYLLAGGQTNYDDSNGIERINKYASIFGLSEKTGIEINENQSKLATQYPVMAAIGQSDTNITTIALGRYVTAVANYGNVYNLTFLDHVQNKNGDIIEEYGPSIKNQVNVLSRSGWSAIHTGMEDVVKDIKSYDDCPVQVAGKTGTAQENKLKPSHSLFVGFAPSSDPQIAFAVRIPNGGKSVNAADVSRQIIGCYFNEEAAINNANAQTALQASTSAHGD